MSGQNGNMRPFVDDPERQPSSDSERSLLGQLLMVAGVLALTLAMGGDAWLILKILENGLMDHLVIAVVGIIPIGATYLTAWMFCILSIRAYNNLVLPVIVRYYSWITLIGVLALYAMIMQKLFRQGYLFPNFVAYNIILASVLLALFGLHLLTDDNDLRQFSIPIFGAGMLHLALMLIRYVLNPAEEKGWYYVLGDIWIFAAMQTVAGLMLAHTGIFNPLRQTIKKFFRDRGNLFR